MADGQDNYNDLDYYIPGLLWSWVRSYTCIDANHDIGVKTLGFRLTKLEPIQGFAAETAASTAIQIASFSGIPLSTTHTISTAIMGVGSAHRLSAVRWGVGREIVMAWILTFPICFGIGALIPAILQRVL